MKGGYYEADLAPGILRTTQRQQLVLHTTCVSMIETSGRHTEQLKVTEDNAEDSDS